MQHLPKVSAAVPALCTCLSWVAALVVDWDLDFLPRCFWSASLPQQQEVTFLIRGNFGQSASVLLPVSPALVSACSYLSSYACVHVPLILKLQGQELSWLLNSLFYFFFLFSFSSSLQALERLGAHGSMPLPR